MKRRFLLAVTALTTALTAAVALLVTIAPGTSGVAALATPVKRVAHIDSGNGGWDPAPFPPTFDRAGGVVCDFAVHGESLVDEVERHVILTYADGSVHREALMGTLIIRLTNTSNGKSYDADVSGRAIIEHHTDGSLTEYIEGPALARVAAGRTNLDRGLYLLDGVYTVDFSTTGFLTFSFVVGGATDLCPRLA